jgi:hypothetical protein
VTTTGLTKSKKEVGTMRKLAAFLMGIAGFALTVCSDGAMAATECNGTISGTVIGGLVVNDGDFCVLGGARISGGVRVNEGGILIGCGSTINGGLIANGATNLIFGAEEIDCDGDVINGGVRIRNTSIGVLGAPLALERSTIHGAVHLTGNQGPIAVAGDTIAGGLFCSDNAFDLFDEGMSNVVTGAIRCEFLVEEPESPGAE